MLDGDLTSRILGCCFEVANELGAGFLEAVYEKALYLALQQAGVPVEAQHRVPVYFRGQSVGDYWADLLVGGRVIVEIKAVKSLAPEHAAQLINYLRATGHEVGLLVNFGSPRIQFRRFERRGNTVQEQARERDPA